MSNLLSLHWYHISIFRIKSLVIVTNGFGRSTGWRRPFGHSCRKALWDHLRGQSQTQNPFGSFDGTLAHYHLVFWMFTLMGDFRQPQTGMGVPYFEGNLSRKNSDVLSNGKPVGLPLGQIRISGNNFIWIEPLNVIGCHYTASGMVLDLFKPITGSGSIFGHYGFQFLQHWHVAIHFDDAANQTQNVVLFSDMQWRIHCYKTLTISPYQKHNLFSRKIMRAQLSCERRNVSPTAFKWQLIGGASMEVRSEQMSAGATLWAEKKNFGDTFWTDWLGGMVVNVCRHGHGKFLALLLFCNGQKYLAETLRLIQKIPHSFFLQNVCKVLKIGGYFFVKRMTLQTLWPILQNKVSTKKSERWKKKQNLLS